MNTCATCRWFRAILTTRDGGLCRRYPPSMLASTYPSVSEGQSCGEHATLESLDSAQAVQGKPAASEPTTFECAACKRQVSLAELRPQKFMEMPMPATEV